MEKLSLVFIVISKIELFDKLIIAFNDAGIHGTTFNSVGMAQELALHEDSHIIAAWRAFMTSGRTENRTMFTVVPESKIELISRITNEVVGDLSKPDTGIIFATPISYAEGIDGCGRVNTVQ